MMVNHNSDLSPQRLRLPRLLVRILQTPQHLSQRTITHSESQSELVLLGTATGRSRVMEWAPIMK